MCNTRSCSRLQGFPPSTSLSPAPPPCPAGSVKYKAVSTTCTTNQPSTTCAAISHRHLTPPQHPNDRHNSVFCTNLGFGCLNFCNLHDVGATILCTPRFAGQVLATKWVRSLKAIGNPPPPPPGSSGPALTHRGSGAKRCGCARTAVHVDMKNPTLCGHYVDCNATT